MAFHRNADHSPAKEVFVLFTVMENHQVVDQGFYGSPSFNEFPQE
jgi:hypothetical protein